MLTLGRSLLDPLFAYVGTSVSTISGFIYIYFRVLKNEQSDFYHLHAPPLFFFSFSFFAESTEILVQRGWFFLQSRGRLPQLSCEKQQ